MMRVLIVHNHYQDPGGEDAVFRQECDLLAADPHFQVETLAFQNHRGFRGLLQFASYPWNRSATRRILQHIRRFNPDIVHVHNIHYAIGPDFVRRLHREGIPVVMTVHNFRLICPTATLFHQGNLFLSSLSQKFPWTAVRRRVHRGSLLKTSWLAITYALHRRQGTWKLVSKYLVLTQFSKDLFLRHFSEISKDKFSIKPNFLPDPLEIQPTESSRADSQRPQSQRKSHFLFLGRLTEEKGIHVLIDAFQASEYEVRIAGDGPLKTDVIGYAKRNPNITYLGMLRESDVITELSECAALLFPSIWFEGMPMTLLQAFATSTPVIASDLGAMKAMIQDGREGFLFEAGRTESLRAVLAKWSLLPPEAKQQIGQNARAAYENNYTPTANIRLLQAAYREVLNESTHTSKNS